ncbi:ATP-dependent nuclease [Aquimarina muelleri]|uniref:ATP-dependent nuclease n=1 Tax=Aquimarina muelleri TaxID=279356 RepID=UPI003F68695D
MIIIKSIEINNFRSIVRLDKKVNPNSLNIIVGQNDIGKSNFLKALNLFFNNETEIGHPFRFNDDFSKYTVVPNKKAPEIKIKIEFRTPSRFSQNESIIWTKVWRKYGLHKDEIKTIKGKVPSTRGGALQWLKKIKYKYVPAVRGKEYFNYLMGDLHDSLSEINPRAFNDASTKFIDGLKSQVELLVESISQELGYTSKIGMPTDFKLLFSTLDFSLDKSGAIISLNKRGDGIKAQHIPIILKFIASHYKSVTGRAVITPDTIWGFEEPENNMEMGNAFKLAKIFASFSGDIQIFINTHSPAFYSLAKEFTEETNLYLVKSENEKSGTKLFPVDADNTQVFDKEVGILPIISDYIQKEVELRLLAEQKTNQLLSLKSNTKYLVLSEDRDLSYVKKIFELQGFDINITEYISYESRSNLLAAMQSCKIPLTDKPDLTDIIFHRDSDMYDNDEFDRERVSERLTKLNESSSINHHLFKTDFYDLEAYFINSEHINQLYPNFEISQIETYIDESTEETKEKSIDKLYCKIEQYRKEYEKKGEVYKFSHSKYIKVIQDLYNSNPNRYRYGKTVLGVLVSKLSKGNGTIDLLKNSDKINIPFLKDIVSKN